MQVPESLATGPTVHTEALLRPRSQSVGVGVCKLQDALSGPGQLRNLSECPCLPL